MNNQSRWADVVLECVYCGVTEKQTASVKKLLLNEALEQADIYNIIYLVDACPISRLETGEIQECLDYLMQFKRA